MRLWWNNVFIWFAKCHHDYFQARHSTLHTNKRKSTQKPINPFFMGSCTMHTASQQATERKNCKLILFEATRTHVPATVIRKATLVFAVCIQHVCKNVNMSNHLFGIIVCSDIFVELVLFFVCSFVRLFVTFGSSEMELKWERHQYLRNGLAEKNTHTK